MTRLDWEDLKVFVALTRGGSMRGAGEELGIHASTVARRLEQLERKLGARLFDRGGQGLNLTDSGTDLLEHADRVEREIEQIELHLLGRDERMAGSIRLSLPDAVATSFLMEDIAAFVARYPDISLEMVPAYELVDLSKREADVAIRATSTPPEHLIGRKLASFAICAYASPGYLKTHDPARDPEHCSWLGWDETGALPYACGEAWFPAVPARGVMRNLMLQASAAAAGMGMTLLPCGIADRDRRLVRVPPGRAAVGGELWLLAHPDLRGAARIRAFLELVTDSFRRNQAMLAGASA